MKHKNYAMPFKQVGLTMIELVMTLLIAAVLVGLAAPSFINTIEENNLTAAANDMLAALNLARSTAITQREDVRICKSTNGTSCDNTLNWEQGWLVFIDKDPPGADEVIRVFSALPEGYTLRQGGNFNDWVEFKPSGAARGSSGNSETFRLCRGTGTANSRSVVVTASGSARIDGAAAACP